MSWLQALLLGVVQGATEFLPISSSGHLVLVPWALGWQLERQSFLPFAVIAHWGTVVAVIFSLRTELWSLLAAAGRGLIHRRPFGTSEARLAWLLALATVPAAAAGALLEEQVERAFNAPATVGLLLWGTAALLLLGEQAGARIACVGAANLEGARDLRSMRWSDALLIGTAQALALFPGISRSGATMAAGVGRGLSRLSAARFSFLLAVPIMLGAGAVSLADLLGRPAAAAWIAPLVAGFSSSALVGMLAIRWLLSYLGRGSLRVFALYCALAGAAALGLSALRG